MKLLRTPPTWRRKFFKASAIALAAALGAVASTQARDFHLVALPSLDASAVSDSRLIEQAFELSITPRGQQFLNDHVHDVLKGNGFDLSAGSFSGFSYRAQEPLTLEALRQLLSRKPRPSKVLSADDRADRIVESVRKVRDGLQRWLKNFKINDPLLQASTSGIEYQATIRRMGLRVDTPATRSFLANGDGPGAILILEAEIPDLTLRVDQIRAQDLQNPFLGEFGLDQFSIRIKPGSPALKLEIPMEVRLGSNRRVSVQIRPSRSNFNLLDLEMNFAQPLKLPDIRIRVVSAADGRDKPQVSEVKLDTREIEQMLLGQREALLDALQSYLSDFVSDNLHTLVNEKLAARLSFNPSEIFQIDPPGGPDELPPSQKFLFGILLKDFQFDPSTMSLSLAGFVEDPLNPQAAAAPLPPSKNGRADAGALEADDNDALIGINPKLINRFLTLSFFRGYFKDLTIGSSDAGSGSQDLISLVTPPVVVVDGTQGTDKITLKVDALYRTADRLTRLVAVKDALHMKFDLILRLKNTNSGLKVILDRIDMNTLWLDEKTLRRLGFRKIAIQKIRGAIEAANADFARNETLLTSEVPLPSSLYGQKLSLERIEARSGILQLFMNLGEHK